MRFLKGIPKLSTRNQIVVLSCIAWLLVNLFRASCGTNGAWNFYLSPATQLLLTAGWIFLSKKEAGAGTKDIRHFVVLVLAGLAPILIGISERMLHLSSEPWEVLAILAFANCGLILSLAPETDGKFQKISAAMAVISVFLILAIEENWWVNVLGGLFCCMALYWMASKYWAAIENKSADEEQKGGRIQLSVYLTSLVTIALLGAFFSRISAAYEFSLLELSFFSGGTTWADRYARSGVGDGELLTSATSSVDTIGPVDSDVFLETKGLTLFDVVSDQYGEPRKPQGNKAIALKQMVFEHKHQKIAQGTKTSNQLNFTVARNPKNKSKKSLEKSDALFFVKGSAPNHFSMTVFKNYQNGIWQAEQKENSQYPMPDCLFDRKQAEVTKPWMLVSSQKAGFGRLPHLAHEIQIVNLQSLRFPTPPGLNQYCLDKVNRAEFFRISETGGPILNNGCPRIPRMTVAHTRSTPLYEFVNQRNGEAIQTDRSKFTEELQLFESGRLIDNALDQVGTQAGNQWEKVQRVAKYMKSNFQHIQSSGFDPKDGGSVEAFLKQEGGPDYMFATTAALLLRRLEIPARLVSGFYISPDQMDSETGQIAVHSTNLHFWVEVCIDGKNWIPIEPTPGFHDPVYGLTYWQSFVLLILDTKDTLVRNPWILACLFCVVLAIYLVRHRILDFLWTTECRIRIFLGNDQKHLAIGKLLEYRGKLAGRKRPTGMTLSSFCKTLVEDLSSEGERACEQFCELLSQSLYSNPAQRSSVDRSESSDSNIQVVLNQFSYTRIRKDLKKERKRLSLQTAMEGSTASL